MRNNLKPSGVVRGVLNTSFCIIFRSSLLENDIGRSLQSFIYRGWLECMLGDVGTRLNSLNSTYKKQLSYL